jgi:predicted phosphohydrolase
VESSEPVAGVNPWWGVKGRSIMAPLSVAITADLHWGNRRGAEETRMLVDHLRARPPDLLLLAGDLGTGNLFEDCLRLFAEVPCRKALVPGNHDLWVPAEDAPPDSLEVYQRLLPEASARQGFHYLDSGPLLLPAAGLGVVGAINWYDYSWAIDAIRARYPGEEHRLHSKRFTRGRHNDGVFVRWPLDDVSFTSLVAATLERHLLAALAQVEKVIVVTHHPPFYGLSFPRPGPPDSLDSFLWDAFAGNVVVEQLLARHGDRIDFAFCGHTHRARQSTLRGIRGYNVGSDYPYKRLLWLEWPAGTVEEHQFGLSE